MANVADVFFSYGSLTGSISGSTDSQLLLHGNPQRKAFYCTNDSPAYVFLRFNEGPASSAVFNLKIPPNTIYEMPPPVLTCEMHFAMTSATGAMRFIEVF